MQDLTVTSGTLRTDNVIYRNITISGTASVAGGSDVELKAVNSIQMSPSFAVPNNAIFSAHLVSGGGTYEYDAIGNLVSDHEKGAEITWNPQGKVKSVNVQNGLSITTFRYDAMGNRVEKKVVANSVTKITRYLRDASGNVMAVYNDTTMIEQPIYGSSRVGMYIGGGRDGKSIMNLRRYELTNHLGNVLSVISDKVTMTSGVATATVLSTSDYYAFGSSMAGRTWSDPGLSYRYGFNGKEKDADTEWGSTEYDYGFRIYNPSIGKFLSVDPLTRKYPSWSPYPFAMDRPIDGIDMDGLEWTVHTDYSQTGNTINIVNTFDLKIRVVNQSKIVTSAADVDLILEQIKTKAESRVRSTQMNWEGDNEVIEHSKLNITFDMTPLGSDEKVDAEAGFFMRLFDEESKIEVEGGKDAFIAGNAFPGYIRGYTQHNVINVAVTIDGQLAKPELYDRTASHEIGHPGGLPHPWMHNANVDLKIKDADQSNRKNKKRLEIIL